MNIKIQNLNKYPELKAFLDSEPPNIISIPSKTTYRVRISCSIKAYDILPLQAASLYGKIEHIRFLKLNWKEFKIATFIAIHMAAMNGHVATLKYLMKHLSDDEKKEVVKTSNYSAFRMAIFYGHTATVQYLGEYLTPAEQNDALRIKNYAVVLFTIESGDTSTLQYIENYLTSVEKKEVVKANDYAAFHSAVRNGHTSTIQHLLTYLSPTEKNVAVKARVYNAIISAAAYGHAEMLQHLFTHLSPTERNMAVKAIDYSAIRGAVGNGHTATLYILESYLTDAEKAASVRAKSYNAILVAIRHGYTTILQHLDSHLTDAENRWIVKSGNFEAIRIAARYRHTAILHHFFKMDIALAYTEMHVREYGRIVLPYVRQKLASLRMDKVRLEANYPNEIFNVSMEEARCLYYMARHLIRVNPPECRDALLFLFDIPQVKALAHQQLYNDRENELLRLAQANGNLDAVQILLRIPAVNDLAIAHNYYREESRGTIDLQTLAANSESSMTTLTQGEQQRLFQVTKQYDDTIKQYGVNYIICHLRETLKARYESNPARIPIVAQRKLDLPFLYSDFQRIQLSQNEKQRALRAYYQHKDHTAFRYLSKPNHWMAPNASFVAVDETRTQRWSTFEEYQPLIALLYCAALDKNMSPTDGFTFETRLEHFIDELAHIGRAHNWDKTRINHSGQLEAYDDLEGDKPSCFSGVKRRLFQSVLGHPLLMMLTEDKVLAEINDFARAHFFASINDTNRELVLGALSKFIEGETLTAEDTWALATTNVSEEKYNQFIQLMTKKYAEQLTYDSRFVELIQGKIGKNTDQIAHILNFNSVMQSLYASAQPNPKLVSSTGLFSASSGSDEATCTSVISMPKN